MDNYLLPLFQLTDSQLPTGAFSHSYGLETYIQNDQVTDAESFSSWINIYLDEQLTYTDGLMCRLVYEALEKEDIPEIWMLDRMITVQNLPREVRDGSKMMGERMLSLALSLYDFPILTDYQATNSCQSIIWTSCYCFYDDRLLLECTRRQAQFQLIYILT